MDDASSVNEDLEEEKINFSSYKNLDYIFWLLAIICVTLYGGFLPFNNIAAAFLTNTYFKDKGMSEKDSRNSAGMYMAIPFFMGIFFVPLFGYILDKVGKRAYFALLSAILGFLCFIMFYFLPPIIPLITLGMTYSLFASVIWPSIAIVTKKEYAGLAFGISTSFQNAGLALFPVIVATILTNTNNNYYISLGFFLLMMGISFLMCILLILEDKKQNNILNNLGAEEMDNKDINENDIDKLENKKEKDLGSEKLSRSLSKTTDDEGDVLLNTNN